MSQQAKNLKEIINRLKRAKEANSFEYKINKHDFENIKKNYTFMRKENENGKNRIL